MAQRANDSPILNPSCDARRPAVPVTRRIYFFCFGLVYLLAFLSLWSQVHDLIGQHGLLPVGRYFQAVHERFGVAAYRMLPSLCWIVSNDLMLHLLCGAGSLLSLSLAFGLAPRPTLLLLWTIYLSLSVAGQDFFSFQWDTLLLEMTVCSWLYAPGGWRPDWRVPSSHWAHWPLWGLAFKLMFLSGLTKLLSGDRSWIDGTALDFHYFTQPIPSWPAWYAHQLPLGFDRFALFALFAVEIILPFGIFAGRWGRTLFGLTSMALMVAIEVTGNFGFFNLQTIVLCIPLIDEGFLKWVNPRRWQNCGSVTQSASSAPKWRLTTVRCAVVTILSISLLTGLAEISRTARAANLPGLIMIPIQWADTLLLSWGKPWVLEPLMAFRTINGYGLFRVMTTQRHEIVVEISDDGSTWTACEFPYKPGSIDRYPPIVAPHMPRLDWQMWFAALNPRGNQHWLSALIRKILDGSPTAARLLNHPELETSPPRFVRLALYEYTFTNADQRRATGHWWNRSFVGNLTGPIK